MAHVPRVRFLNGFEMPQIGLGTWKSKPGEVCNAVKEAISAGYRHVDCAHAYQNETEVGEGIAAKVADGTVTREDLFVTSKLWNTFHRSTDVRPALQATIDRLGLKYLDLYLIHWPMSYAEDREMFPKDANGKFIYSQAGFMQAWKALEDCVDAGLVRSIGLSNFNHEQIERIWQEARHKPANLQVELHPYLTQPKLLAFCQEKGIVVTAHSPLGSRDRPWAKPDDLVLIDDPVLVGIAARINKTPAQVLIRWAIQRGTAVIPKSVTSERIRSNFQVFDFELSSEDVDALSALNRNLRNCHLDWVKDHPDWPFNIEF